MIRFAFRPLVLTSFALSIAACGEEAEEPTRETELGGEASGEVLGGSISDDMIPLEQLRSQSPSAPRPTSASNDGGSSSSDDESDAEPAPELQEAEASTEAPAPEPAAEAPE